MRRAQVKLRPLYPEGTLGRAHLERAGVGASAVAEPHLMWSYFWKSVLYSTARCCSSTSRQLP